jgi:hypothetical protein
MRCIARQVVCIRGVAVVYRFPDGRTLGELCEHLDMTRQALMQYLAVVEAANLIATSPRGTRETAFSQSAAFAGDL